MKTKLIFLALTAFALAACDQKRPEAEVTLHEVDLGENPFFLITDLPPELLMGTVVPIHLQGVKSTPVAPGQASGPGTRRVIYRKVESRTPAAE